MSSKPTNGLISLPSNHPVDETLSRLHTLLAEKNVKIFALIDHSGEAERAGLKMPNTKLLIFGNPKAGTPLMQAAQTIAIDLPLKALIWEDEQGRSWLTYNDPEYLRDRHQIPPELLSNLAGATALLKKAAE